MSNFKNFQQRLKIAVVILLFISITSCASMNTSQTRGEKWILFSDTHLFADYDWKDNGHSPNHNFAQARTAVLAEDKAAGFVILGMRHLLLVLWKITRC